MAPLFRLSAAIAVLAAGLANLPTVFAQTSTDCNPLHRDDCPTDPALGRNVTFDFATDPANDNVWTADAGTVNYENDLGGQFIIQEQGQSIRITTKFYIFFGRVSVLMQAAKGTGIVSSIVMESDDLDEVDWELIGGNNSYVQSNFFGKGNTTSYDRAVWHPVDDPQGNFRNYTTVWTKEKLEWYIDGAIVRTLPFDDPVANGGANYPQTPMFVRLGLWAGGDPDKNSPGTVEWAGGETDFSQAPFTMNVQNVYVEDFSTGSSYSYGDNSGSWQSIKVVDDGDSNDVQKAIDNPPGLGDDFNRLSKGSKIAIFAVSGAVGLALLTALMWYFFKQRRAGRADHERLLNETAAENADMLAYKEMMRSGRFSVSGPSHGH